VSTQTEQPVVSRWQRTLLPGDFLQTSDVRRSARDWLVDAFLFVLAIAIGVLGLVDTWHDHNAVAAGLDIALGAIAILALWWRREHPLAVALLTVSFSVFAAMAGGAAIIAVFNVALRGSRRALVGIAALALFTLAIFPILYPGSGYVEEVVFGVLILVIAIGWGLFARVRRELVLSLRERAERLETEQQWHVEQAREAERRRIAREMHDVLAHRLSLLSVHAGALEFRPDAPPEEVAEAAGVIRETAQTALQELRDVIGVLRDDAEDSSEPPQPTLSEIPALVEESRAAGMRVETRIELPDDGTLPAALGRTAYRIVQEGLTNARKHAPAAAVEVSVSEEQGPQLVVEVFSRRAVGVAAVAAARGGLSGAGTGLVGLAERVALAGGELSYGPDEKGDFVLRAVLPWSP
jgi:signal transduction histidine kinase